MDNRGCCNSGNVIAIFLSHVTRTRGQTGQVPSGEEVKGVWGQHARVDDTVAHKGWASGSAHLTPGMTGEGFIGVAPRGDESEYHFQPA